MPALSSSRAAFVLLIFCILILSVEAAQCLGDLFVPSNQFILQVCNGAAHMAVEYKQVVDEV